MTDDHETRRQLIAFPVHLLYSMHTTCIHVVQRSAVLADPAIRLIKHNPHYQYVNFFFKWLRQLICF